MRTFETHEAQLPRQELEAVTDHGRHGSRAGQRSAFVRVEFEQRVDLRYVERVMYVDEISLSVHIAAQQHERALEINTLHPTTTMGTPKFVAGYDGSILNCAFSSSLTVERVSCDGGV